MPFRQTALTIIQNTRLLEFSAPSAAMMKRPLINWVAAKRFFTFNQKCVSAGPKTQFPSGAALQLWIQDPLGFSHKAQYLRCHAPIRSALDLPRRLTPGP